MALNSMTALWARTALVWFLITIAFGFYMGMTQQFQFSPSHAHMGLLGWLSAAVFGFLYAVAGEGRPGSRAPRFHWAAHNLGVATMTGALFFWLRSQNEAFEPIIPLGAAIVIASAIWLTAMMWPRLRSGGDQV